MLFGAADVASAQPLAPGSNARTMIWDGVERPYLVHVPPGWNAEAPTPLVVAIHGFVSNPALHQTISGMSPVADENGFLVVYPGGVSVAGQNSWNAGGCCQLNVHRQNDIGFVRAVVAAVQAATAIDAERIYATGLSNGGAMTHYLACNASDLFAAAAPVAFGLPVSAADCNPERPLPLLNFMGLNDALVDYDGGIGAGALDTFAQWRDINACGNEEPEIVEVVGGSDCMIDTSCGSGAQTGLCSVDSRSFPGTAFEGHIVYANPDIDIPRKAWGFMSKFTLSMSVPEPAAPLLQTAALAVVWCLRGARRRRR